MGAACVTGKGHLEPGALRMINMIKQEEVVLIEVSEQ
jgi:hypothetical protein